MILGLAAEIQPTASASMLQPSLKVLDADVFQLDKMLQTLNLGMQNLPQFHRHSIDTTAAFEFCFSGPLLQDFPKTKVWVCMAGSYKRDKSAFHITHEPPEKAKG